MGPESIFPKKHRPWLDNFGLGLFFGAILGGLVLTTTFVSYFQTPQIVEKVVTITRDVCEPKKK